MFKYVLSLTFAVGLASAATITTSATCDGVTTIGTTSAMCQSSDAIAYAAAGPFGVNVYTSQAPCCSFHGSASAYSSDTYAFTIMGGTGQGIFEPCILFAGDPPSYSVTMSFGSFSYSINTQSIPLLSTCDFGYGKMPFTFGVPQIITISASGMAGGNGVGYIQLGIIRFFDLSGNPLSNVTYTLVSTTIPEPSSRTSLSVGLIFLLSVALFRLRFRERLNQ